MEDAHHYWCLHQCHHHHHCRFHRQDGTPSQVNTSCYLCIVHLNNVLFPLLSLGICSLLPCRFFVGIGRFLFKRFFHACIRRKYTLLTTLSTLYSPLPEAMMITEMYASSLD
jgi:hypothetical protein